MADEPNGADVGVDAFGVKANIKNVKSLNTLATVATLVIVSAASAYGYSSASAHVTETKEANAALVSALKEQTQIIRESMCQQNYHGPESQKVAFCKQVAR